MPRPRQHRAVLHVLPVRDRPSRLMRKLLRLWDHSRLARDGMPKDISSQTRRKRSCRHRRGSASTSMRQRPRFEMPSQSENQRHLEIDRPCATIEILCGPSPDWVCNEWA